MKDLRYLPYLERVACQSALDIVRRRETPGSEQKDFITHSIPSSVSTGLFVGFPHLQVSQGDAVQW